MKKTNDRLENLRGYMLVSDMEKYITKPLDVYTHKSGTLYYLIDDLQKDIETQLFRELTSEICSELINANHMS